LNVSLGRVSLLYRLNLCVKQARLLVDNCPAAVRETGDLAIPIPSGATQMSDIEADLFALCRGEKHFIRNRQDITLFKSVGHALKDLATPQLV